MVGGHATVGRLSNNVFGRFKQLGKILKKVTDPDGDRGARARGERRIVEVQCQAERAAEALDRAEHQLSENLKKVTERSRDSGRRSRDRLPTVKQRFLDVSSS